MSSSSSSHNLDLTGCKKRKRGDRIFRFKTFPEQVELNGTFRENVKTLVEYGHLETNYIWSFQLQVRHQPPFHVFLFVVQEAIESSSSRHCNHCQYIGWGHHLICNNKYHFFVPSKDTIGACLSYNNSNNSSGGNNWAKGKGSLVELEGHVMHGVLHSNGFGHLLCVNGAETGSDLTGHQIMDFWDRLCNGLRARKVSLNDIAQKRNIELRLLHGVAYGEPWFARWGYRFGRGSFGVSQTMYQKAIEAIQGMPLCLLLHLLGTATNHLNDLSLIFSRYQSLSDHSLLTLSDLFRYMLDLNSNLPKDPNIASYNPGILVEPTCRWSQKRVEMATRVIVDSLRRAEFRWVSRQEVRDAARAYIGDTGLLDFVLKSLGNHVVGNYLVRRSLNPVTKVLEYCLEDISNVLPNQDGLLLPNSKMKMGRGRVTKAQLMKDMFYLYKNILKDPKHALNTGIFSAIPVATRIILDSKYLTKDYYPGELSLQPELVLEEKLKLFCTVMVRTHNKMAMPLPPYECVMVRNNATINEVKQQVETCFRDLYWGLRNVVLDRAVDLHGKGEDLVFGVVEVGHKLVFEGVISGNIEEEMCESDSKNARIVDCHCGTKEDDGERMVSCDICEVWQHTRCVRIPNNQDVPHIFLCNRCEQEIVVLPSLP